MKVRDLTGQKFNRLTAIRRVENIPGYGQARWLFRCDCGNEIETFGYNVAHARQKSCGCYVVDHPSRFRHGATGSRAYHIWAGMRQRCQNKDAVAFEHYGARGISVCDRWEVFENFLSDMGWPPDGATLERIDNDGGYCPENCKWGTRKEQVRNRRVTVMYTHNNETLSLSEWAERFNLPYRTLWHRYTIAGKRGDELFSHLRVTRQKPRGTGGVRARA